jgi:uncharacterized SAM-binding protein YcdF (DUF218 family)
VAGICVVVLGGGHSPDGLSLDARTPERVKRGVELFMAARREAGENADVRLVCSGAWAVTRSVPPPRTEAALMADLAVTLGVPPSAILREERSLDTIGNLAVVGSEILPRIEPDEVVVVSSNFHMRRVRYLVGRVWGGRWRVTFAGAPEDLPVRTRLLLAVRERRLMLLMRRLLRKIPRGDIAGCLRARPLREAPSWNG